MTQDTPTPTDRSLVLASDDARVPEVHVGDTVRASWPFSLADIRSNMAHCSPDRRQAIIDAFCWCIDPKHPVRKTDFARAVDYDENTIYRILTGRYRKPDGTLLDVPEKLAKGIRDFLKLEKERWLGGQTVFIQTPTSKRIATMCELVRESRTIGFVWGPSQGGKTWALEHHAHENNHGRTPYCRLKAASGLAGMLRAMSRAVGNSDNANTADMIDRLKRALDPNTLFILDEVHQLSYTYRKESFFACVEVIREIFDEAGCGLVLCGTRLMIDQVGAARQAELEQAWKRGVHKLNLTGIPTKADVAAILAASQLELPARNATVSIEVGDTKLTEKPFEVLRQVAKKEGLRAITERLRYARKIANRRRNGATLSWATFIEAHLTIEGQGQEQNDGWEDGK